MTRGRGREARIRPEFRDLYPGLPATKWQAVEAVLQQVAELATEDRGTAGAGADSRRLRDEHFEFRGSTVRPEGSRPRLSRASDPATEPERLAELRGELDAEEDLFRAREREADQTIARAEHLRQQADALQRDFERLRERAAELELRTKTSLPDEDADTAGPRPDQA